MSFHVESVSVVPGIGVQVVVYVEGRITDAMLGTHLPGGRLWDTFVELCDKNALPQTRGLELTCVQLRHREAQLSFKELVHA